MMYFDHNATTPLAPEVEAAMRPFQTGLCGNPSSIHKAGRDARLALDRARDAIAASLGVAAEEIIFTSGATEANNIALKGYAHARGKGHILTTAIEHPSVLEPLRQLEKEGFDLTVLPVNAEGRISMQGAEAALRDDTFLISVQWANNETGTLQDIATLSGWAKNKGLVLHVDAAQAMGRVPVSLGAMAGVDMLSFSAHKFYGPKGVGGLFVRKGLRLNATQQGGKHEKSLRPGTENVAGIVGMAKALEMAVKDLPKEAARLNRLKEQLKEKLRRDLEDMEFNGPQEASRQLPNTLNICFHGVDAQSLLMNLDLEGLCVSTGAACSSGSLEPSPVLMAMKGAEVAKSSLRISMGRMNDEAQVQALAETLIKTVKHLRTVTGPVTEELP